MDKLTTLWQGAAYQDNLLQSYRKLSMLLQSVLLLIGTWLFMIMLSFRYGAKAGQAYLVLLAVTLLALYVWYIMKKLIAARCEDVNYYHNQIIEAEQHLPKEQQVLTAFKVYQKYGRKEADPSGHFLQFEITPAIQQQLIEKGKGHTRKLLDRNIPIGILCVWACLHIAILLLVLVKHG